MGLPFVIGIVTLYVAISTHAVPAPYNNTEAPLASIDESYSDPLLSEQFVLELANNFSSFYFQKVAAWKTTDVVISPLSLFIPLSMLSYGARGETRKMFLDAIGLPESKTQMAKVGYENFLDKLAAYDVRVKTKIFVPSNVRLKPDFVDLSTKVFNSEIQSVDVTDGVMNTSRINEWVATRTNNNVTSLFEPQQIAPDPSIVLVNTVHFKGIWKTAFNSSLTLPRPFSPGKGLEKNVSTMLATGRFRHGRLDDFNADFIELPYKSNSEDDAMSMCIILPDSEDERPLDWLYLVHKLRNMNLTRLLNSTEEELEVYLPKFKIEMKQSLNSMLTSILNPDLSVVENRVNSRPDVDKIRERLWSSDFIKPPKIEKYENAETGDFSEIFESPGLSNLGESVTKIVIEVDEEGERAAESSGVFYKPAVTATSDRKTRSVVASPKKFKVDRPFHAMILTKEKVLTNIFSMFVPGGNFLRKGVHMQYIISPWATTIFYTVNPDGENVVELLNF